MALLFDENLSFKLVQAVAGSLPGSHHVRDCGLIRADDRAVWEYARAKGLAIVTRDSDFYDLSLVHGAPPKIVWLRSVNTSTAAVVALVTGKLGEIERFLADSGAACLILRH